MPITIKATVFLKCSNPSAGWSETYYRTVSTFDEGRTACLALGVARRGFLAKGISMLAIRYSDVDLRGDSGVISYDNQIGDTPISGMDCDLPWQSFLYRLESTSIYRRMMHFRGLPDSSFGTTAFEKQGFATVLKAIDKFCSETLCKGWFLRVHLRGSDLPPLKVQAADMTVAGWLIKTVGAHLLQPADRVKLFQMNTIPSSAGANGIFVVGTVVSETEFKLAGKAAIDPSAYLGGGYMQKQAIGYSPIAKYGFMRFSHKKTGVPFDVTRGRHSKRKC